MINVAYGRPFEGRILGHMLIRWIVYYQSRSGGLSDCSNLHFYHVKNVENYQLSLLHHKVTLFCWHCKSVVYQAASACVKGSPKSLIRNRKGHSESAGKMPYLAYLMKVKNSGIHGYAQINYYLTHAIVQFSGI